MDNRSIVMLNRGQLQPHPDNPRKDLGFHIRDEWKPVLDGTSELYEKKGGK